MLKHNFFTQLVIVFALILSAGCEKAEPPFKCTDPIGCVNIAPDQPVKLGVLQALTGKVASLGHLQIDGIKLAIDKREGRLLGHPIVLQTEDTECSGEGGGNAALKVVADPQIVAILGSTCSGAAAVAAKVMSEAGLVMVSGNNSAPFLTAIAGKRAPNWQAGYFRVSFNEESAGKAAAEFAFQKLGVRKAAVINDGDIYTRGLTDGFKQAFETLGGEIVLYATINKGDADMKPDLEAVMASKAGLLFFPIFEPEGNFIVQQARKIEGFENVILMTDGALIQNTFIDAVKTDGVGMYFVGPAPPEGAAGDALDSEYTSKYNKPPSNWYYQNAYNATNLLMKAMEKAAVREKDGTLHIGRQALRDALYAADFEGATGRIACDEFGDCASPRFNIMRLKDPGAGVEGLRANIVYTYAGEK